MRNERVWFPRQAHYPYSLLVGMSRLSLRPALSRSRLWCRCRPHCNKSTNKMYKHANSSSNCAVRFLKLPSVSLSPLSLLEHHVFYERKELYKRMPRRVLLLSLLSLLFQFLPDCISRPLYPIPYSRIQPHPAVVSCTWQSWK